LTGLSLLMMIAACHSKPSFGTSAARRPRSEVLARTRSWLIGLWTAVATASDQRRAAPLPRDWCCVSNDLFHETTARGILLTTVRVVVRGDFSGEPAESDPVAYDVELAGEATPDQLEEPVAYVDAIAEIPNSVRGGTEVRLANVNVVA